MANVIRSQVKISEDVYTELYKDLEGLSPRARSERLRVLATLGLLSARGESFVDTGNVSISDKKKIESEEISNAVKSLDTSLKNL